MLGNAGPLGVRPTAARAERYEALGIHRLELSAPTGELVDAGYTLADLDATREIIERYGEAS